MKIIYISTLLPQSVLEEVLKQRKETYVIAPQKFHRNLVHGFISNGHQVKVLSYLPDCIKYVSSLTEEGIEYEFCKYTSKPGLKHIQILKGINRSIKCLKVKGFEPDIIICDSLNVSLCLGAFWAGKYQSIKTVGIVTDLLGISEHEDKGIMGGIAAKVSNSYIKFFDCYVFLTQQMNNVINPHNKPYIVMEGICELNQLYPNVNSGIKKLFYAGGRPSKDGIDLLIPAFKRIKDKNIQLHIYGPVSNDLIGADLEDSRIIYHGIVDNKIVVAEECSSYLLINPRPTGETYTKYSFPSKLLEYMTTGVPVVTTKLAGIPEEYYEYVFSFDSCDIDTYYSTLKKILSFSEEEMSVFGQKAQRFVLENKNNIAQTARIINFLNKMV